MIREIVEAGIAVELLTGCVPVTNMEAATTPFGIVYFTDNPSQFIIEHEQCHKELADKEGIKYWIRIQDPVQACAEEVRCGIDPTKYPKTYPQCVKK